MKAGYKTTEFWVTLGTMLTSILVGLRVLSPGDASELQTRMSEIGELVVQLAAAITPIVYIVCRTAAKIRHGEWGDE